MSLIWDLVQAGVGALEEYIVYHTITCLVAAFLLAGAIVSFVSKQTIIHYLGRAASMVRSFVIAAFGSFGVAACSCTVIPVSAGLYHGGGAIGPAFIILWVAPAANILALVYTGAILGSEMVAVRLVAALVMAGVVGVVMTVVFRASETQRAEPAHTPGAADRLISPGSLVLIGLLVATLLGPNYLVRQGPFVHKVLITGLGLAAVFGFALWHKKPGEVGGWLRESWWFVRMIVPFVLVGVFIVGVLGELIPETWIQRWLSGSGLSACFLATIIGGVSYFATMTEAPFVDKLMSMGMGRGPAMALLLTGPGISLPNLLAVARVFGWRKAGVYAATVICLGTLVGWVTGNFVLSDG
ncbi:MAG: permease [Planctomycetota bacterium]